MSSPSSTRRARCRDGAARGVVFDMDGVLVDSGAHHRGAWRALLEEIGVTPEPDFWRRTIGRPAEEAVGHLLGVDLSPFEAYRLATRKRDHYVRLARGGVQAVPGALQFLAALSERGVPCAVATSASRHEALRLLRNLDLAAHFAAIVTAEDVRLGKPDPEVYVLAAAALRVAPLHCLAFEDSVVGVEAARRAGMTVFGVTTSHADEELRAAGAYRTIASFEGLGWPP